MGIVQHECAPNRPDGVHWAGGHCAVPEKYNLRGIMMDNMEFRKLAARYGLCGVISLMPAIIHRALCDAIDEEGCGPLFGAVSALDQS